MIGPIYLSISGGAFGGLEVDIVFLAGVGGTVALYADSLTDEVMFNLYIAGKLRLKEQVCPDEVTALDTRCPTGYAQPNHTRISPP